MTDDATTVAAAAARMALLTDARDWATLTSLFADAVELDYTSLNGGDPVTISPTQLVAGWRENLERLDATQHLLGTVHVQLDGDTAQLTCAVTGTHRRETNSGGPLWTVGGHYDMTLRKVADCWLIAALRLRVAWATGNQAIMQP